MAAFRFARSSWVLLDNLPCTLDHSRPSEQPIDVAMSFHGAGFQRCSVEAGSRAARYCAAPAQPFEEIGRNIGCQSRGLPLQTVRALFHPTADRMPIRPRDMRRIGNSI